MGGLHSCTGVCETKGNLIIVQMILYHTCVCKSIKWANTGEWCPPLFTSHCKHVALSNVKCEQAYIWSVSTTGLAIEGTRLVLGGRIPGVPVQGAGVRRLPRWLHASEGHQHSQHFPHNEWVKIPII